MVDRTSRQTSIKQTLTLEQAFDRYVQLESEKSFRVKIREGVETPVYAMWGVVKGAFKMIQTGMSPILRGVLGGDSALQAPNQTPAVQKNQNKSIKQAFQSMSQNPGTALQTAMKGIKEKVEKRAVQFLLSTHREQAEQVGEWAAAISLVILQKGFFSKRRSLTGDVSEKRLLKLEADQFLKFINHPNPSQNEGKHEN